MGRVQDKIAIITGAGKGLGEADALLLAKEGARVIVADIDEQAGRRVASEIGARAQFVQHDVAEEASWQALMDAVLREHGRLDILVNNAGIVVTGSIEDATAEEFRAVMAVNAGGTFFGCKHGIKAMKKTGGGSIINIGSFAAVKGLAFVTAYSASKGAVDALTRAVVAHCVENKLNIRCNTIHPGGFDTPMTRGVTGRPGGADPIDIAHAVLFLASDEARSVNGHTMRVDNAATAF